MNQIPNKEIVSLQADSSEFLSFVLAQLDKSSVLLYCDENVKEQLARAVANDADKDVSQQSQQQQQQQPAMYFMDPKADVIDEDLLRNLGKLNQST
jgi:hypothetical protein